jgi:hypothetical protein
MMDAYRLYRDELGLQVYPCYPPIAHVKDPGKSPAVSAWWEYNSTLCNLEKYFSQPNGKSHNIGCCPKNGLGWIDLDSKPDKGQSVACYLEEHPELAKFPRNITRGGAHLVFICPDFPHWVNQSGRPFKTALAANLTDEITAELFHCDRQNIILPPSIHAADGFIYTWIIIGEVPVISWAELQKLFHFVEPEGPKHRPGRPKKEPAWYHRYRGFLGSLDLVALLDHLGLSPELIDSGEAKYRLTCPWADEHSPTNRQHDTSTVIWQPGAPHWPSFKCSHLHCAQRELEAVLAWAESKEPGSVDKHCNSQRLWTQGQKSLKGKPRVLHPMGRLDSEVYAEIGAIVAPHNVWFLRGEEPCVISAVPSGFEYSADPDRKYKIVAYTTGFKSLTPGMAKSDLEHYIEPGVLDKEGSFEPRSFGTGFVAGMLEAPQFKATLPRIVRILTVPLPIQVGDKLVYPEPGYDQRFGTYLLESAPRLLFPLMSVPQALAVLDRVHSGFCFTSEQSRTHAYARLITPTSRGIIGWTTRVPLWFYCANRPRAGKDYLAAINQIVYEGHAAEDLPVTKDSDETAKRIIAAGLSGRRFMHFSNCVGHIKDENLYQAVTNTEIKGRLLGSNSASADLSIPNEIEFSLSANLGTTARPDFEPRTRKIELAYYIEDPNSRTFPDTYLHRTVAGMRSEVLTAIASLFHNWAQKGFPKGKTVFTSYPQWSDVVGGVMLAAGLGDPCLPFDAIFEVGEDPETDAMSALWREAHLQRPHPDSPLKPDLYSIIEACDDDKIAWFGTLIQPL